MKKTALIIVCLTFSSAMIIAQYQSSKGFYTCNKIDLNKGIQLSNLDEYLVVTGIEFTKDSNPVEVFIKRGDDAVTVTE